MTLPPYMVLPPEPSTELIPPTAAHIFEYGNECWFRPYAMVVSKRRYRRLRGKHRQLHPTLGWPSYVCQWEYGTPGIPYGHGLYREVFPLVSHRRNRR